MKKQFILFLVLLSGWWFVEAGDVKAQGRSNPASSPAEEMYAHEDDLIEVMFSWESRVRLINGAMVDLQTDALEGVDALLESFVWHEWSRITDVPEDVVDFWETNGEQRTGEDLYNLNNIFRLRIPKGEDVVGLALKLEELPGVLLARPVALPMELPAPGNYQSQQGYLFAATNNPAGVDASFVWGKTGGTGIGITVCDLEYSWNYSHADITKAVGSQINTNPYSDPFNNTDHGTAVIGVLVADNNGWGTTGICYGASLKTCATYYNSSWNVPGAISMAIAALVAGDVIVLEHQWEYTPGAQDYIPIEWWLNYANSAQTFNAVYAAITTAIANGIHVVEAGGNGNVNTGNLQWYGNSGAIIVGAGGATSTNDRTRLSFSSYGPRFNLQGWGEQVVTTGYGDLYSSQGVNYYYTSVFSGTSSASPVVAGALICAEGYYLANITSVPPTPAYMSSQLALTGTAQVTPPAGNIGPRPNVKGFVLAHPPQNPTLDFGDAPDLPYPTLTTSNGARHTVTGLKMGLLIDTEMNGQPNGTATGDDISPATSDDEDGVTFITQLKPGQMASVQVIASGPGVLNAWIDFSKINAWMEPVEYIIQNAMLIPGLNVINFQVPISAMPGYTFARFRFNSQGGLPYYGPASDGEVEDYQVFIEELPPSDWGDAPDPTYPTLSGSNGANHIIDGVTYLGFLIDPEPDGQPEPMALGDDLDIFYPPPVMDEDGVVFSSPLFIGQSVAVNVTASAPGFLNGWIDFNINGSWNDPGEHVFIDIMLSPGVNALTISVPPNITAGLTFARFRFSTIQGLSFTGQAPNGEVEDYNVQIQVKMDELDWGDAPDPTFPTLAANNGARHKLDGVTFLGPLADSENDGLPTIDALGDDLNNFDDEDGVIFLWPLAKGNPCKIKVNASVGNALFNGWIDYNGNGSWAEPNEHIFLDLNLVAGDNFLTFIVPRNAVVDTTCARFRFSHQPALCDTGYAFDGEVEDYMVNLIEYTDMKWSQPFDKYQSGIHASDGNIIADDWVCNGEVITDLHWWGNYELNASGQEKRGAGISHFILTIYSSNNCLPGAALITYNVPFVPGLEISTGTVNPESSQIYKYNFMLPQPFIQVKDSNYWLSVTAISNDISNPSSWRWQEANRWFFPIRCGAADQLGGIWQTIIWPAPGMVKYSDMAYEITSWVVDTLYLQNINVSNGQNLCYDANYVISVAGGGTTFTVQSGSSATMIAGLKIRYLPGTHAMLGSNMHGYITLTGQFCPRAPVLTGTVIEPEVEKKDQMVAGCGLKVWPNPTTGRFTLEPVNPARVPSVTIEVYDLMGGLATRQELPAQARYDLSLTTQPPGIYLVRMISGGSSRSVKVVKH